MATCKRRNNTYCVIYQYRTSAGKVTQKWETYMTELEAVQRKALIEYFQANKQYDAIRRLATDYTQTRALQRLACMNARANPEGTPTPQ